MALFFQWIDLLWVLVALALAGKGQRLMSLGFVISCALMMRMQIEMLSEYNLYFGFTGLIPYGAFTRGVACYSLVHIIYFAFLKFAPGSRGSLLLATCLTLFFGGFFASTFIMVL